MKKLAVIVAGAGVWVLAFLLVNNYSISVANTDSSGSIKGIVKLDGNVPDPQKKKPDVDPQACGADDITLEKLIVDKGTKAIKNVYIEIDKATEFKIVCTDGFNNTDNLFLLTKVFTELFFFMTGAVVEVEKNVVVFKVELIVVKDQTVLHDDILLFKLADL